MSHTPPFDRQRQAIETVLRNFDWDDYGMDAVDVALHDNPDSQEWVGTLAEELQIAVTPPPRRTEADPTPGFLQRVVPGADQNPAEIRGFDMLRQVFESQAHFQGLLGHDYNQMSTEELVSYLKDQILALLDEGHEALNEVGWKPWATSRHVNRPEFAGELADILCFLVNLALGVGLTADDLYVLHQEKALRNIKRQEEKYDGIQGKCPTCRRAIDDLKAKNISTGQFGGVDFCDQPECIAAYRTKKGI